MQELKYITQTVHIPVAGGYSAPCTITVPILHYAAQIEPQYTAISKKDYDAMRKEMDVLRKNAKDTNERNKELEELAYSNWTTNAKRFVERNTNGLERIKQLHQETAEMQKEIDTFKQKNEVYENLLNMMKKDGKRVQNMTDQEICTWREQIRREYNRGFGSRAYSHLDRAKKRIESSDEESTENDEDTSVDEE